ncbi:Ubiquitin-conjugating enzyme/RWD-like protein [Naviculisporaceae sp. PSN 640]
MAAAQKRIAKELSDCTSNCPPGMKVHLASESDLHKWHVTMEGPPQSIYAGGTFGLIVTLPPDYPFKAPQITFATRIYHPNVTNDSIGSICLGLLKPEQWKPATRIRSVLEAIRNLLVEPQPDDPLEARIADEYKTDRKGFEKNAKSYLARYAKGAVKFDSNGGSAATEAAAKESSSTPAGGA